MINAYRPIGVTFAAIAIAALTICACNRVAPPGVQSTPNVSPPLVDQVPDAYVQGICGIAGDLQDVVEPLSSLSAHAQANDLVALAGDIDRAKAGITTAQAALDQMPPWPPGDPIVRNLSTSLEQFQSALNQLKVGIANLDPDTLQSSLTVVMGATDQMARATANIEALRAKYNFAC